jgi:hypothetical protein
MGILAELEKLNPTAIAADIESAKSRLESIEPTVAALVNLVAKLVAIAYPSSAIPMEIVQDLAIVQKLVTTSTPSPQAAKGA